MTYTGRGALRFSGRATAARTAALVRAIELYAASGSKIMGFKDTFKTVTKAVTDAVETAKHNARDAASEAQHHAAARAEAEKRSGDSLSPGEQAQSLATEVREEALAKVDSVRQEIRRNL